jgi:hypothetical protein
VAQRHQQLAAHHELAAAQGFQLPGGGMPVGAQKSTAMPKFQNSSPCNHYGCRQHFM